ncbi:Outer membrane efflux protein [Desulfonema limicola]|uniref:Outer membrane efflux protein n=1 Tax=Desulfonema limicola TaxID=45656 RepID=A0A975B8R1_9BACT|nr:TolC family protein [Desulfonema limicola]QTA80845.1 Outer membrane efflux protein [Desulfonema limicola]
MKGLSAIFSILSFILIQGIFIISLQSHAKGFDLSLSQAVARAAAHNPGIKAVEFQAVSAEEKILQAKSGFIPQIQLAGEYSHTNNPMWAFGTRLNQESIAQADFDPDRLNNPDSINNFISSISFSWPLYDQGQTLYSWKQAKLNHEAVMLLADRTRQQVTARTITAYFGALLARKNLEVAKQTLNTARTHLKMVESRYRGGFVVKSDLLRAQVHIAELEQQLAEALSQVDISECMLNVSMGIPENMHYVLTTPLEKGQPLKGSMDSWISQALSERPDLKHMKYQKTIAEKEIAKSRAARHPSFTLAGRYELNSEDMQEQASNYTIGAMVSFNLFSGGRISAKIRDAGAALKQVDAMIQAMEQQICGETRHAFFNAQSAWKRIQVAGAAVSQADESLRIVQNRYNSGLFTITDLLDAETALQQSRTNHLKAVHDFKTAETRLALAAGRIDDSRYDY